MKTFEAVYKLVQQIPKGKVSTYGAIARKLSMSPRVVGYALHLNSDPDFTPCHRVVNRNGRVAPAYAYGGASVQKQLLEKEGITFSDDLHVNLKDHYYNLDITRPSY